MTKPFRFEMQGDIERRKAESHAPITSTGGNGHKLPPRSGDVDLMERPERRRDAA